MMELPLWVLLAPAAVFLLLCFRFARRPKGFRFAAAVLCGAAAAALCWSMLWQAVFLRPTLGLAGSSTDCRVAVLRIEERTDEEHLRAEVRLLEVGGGKLVFPVQILLSGLPESEPGDLLEGKISLSADDRTGISDGVPLRGYAEEELEELGHSSNPRYFFASLQQKLGQRLYSRFERQIGSVAAAVCVGDKTHLSYQTQENYRAAGVSHLLVVSGLHLGLVVQALGALLPRRRILRGLLMSGAVLCFMALTGFTVSVVRAGVMVLLGIIAPVLSESADSLTSLGAAVLLLTALNPAAAADIGLLLSVSSVLGILAGGAIYAEYLSRREARKQKNGRRQKLLGYLVTPVSATLATMPVLTAIGGGISIFSVAVNLIAVPLTTPVVILGLLIALIDEIPLLLIPARACGLCCGLLIRFLNGLTGWIAGLPFGLVYLRGGYALAVVLCALSLLWILTQLRTARLRRILLTGGTALVLMAVALGALLGRGTVQVAAVGYTQQPALVITRGDRAAVLWRGGSINQNAVERYLKTHGIRRLELVVNCSDSDARYLWEEYPQQQYLEVGDVVLGEQVVLLDALRLTISRQPDGVLYWMESPGATLLCATGKTDLTGQPQPDFFFSGTQMPQGLAAERVLVSGSEADWVERCTLPLLRGDEPTVWLRPSAGTTKLLGVE